MDPWNFAIYMVHNIANYWPKDNLRSILRHMSKYTVFRPDISEYQGENFERDNFGRYGIFQNETSGFSISLPCIDHFKKLPHIKK